MTLGTYAAQINPGMKHTRLIFCGLLTILAWAAVVPLARAQFLCHVTAPNDDAGDNPFWYSALYCNGNTCLAMRIYEADLQLAFLRSTDGGNTWIATDSFGVSYAWYIDPPIASFVPIDSLNIFAYGRSDSIYRTTDGGVTWQQETVPTSRLIDDISFSTPDDGFLVVADTVNTVFTTSDGGNHWETAPLPFSMIGGVAQCHDYGQGKRRLFEYYYGRVYTTTDNWKTVDSTAPIISDSSVANQYGFGHCTFGAGDTIFAYGNFLNYEDHPFPLIARTTNAGRAWTLEYNDTIDFFGSVHALSEIDRDTILAGISVNPSILLSTNRGDTWKGVSLLCTDTDFVPGPNYGIALTSGGNVVASYGSIPLFGSSIIVGYPATSTVRVLDTGSEPQSYPNPANTSVTLSGLVAGREVHLLDLLGRDMLTATVPATGSLTLNVSQLPRGMYMVMVEEHGTMVPAGRVILN